MRALIHRSLGLIAATVFCAVLNSFGADGPRPANLETYRKDALIRQGDIARGRELFSNDQKALCARCHSVDGSASAGPTWKGLAGKTETMADGSSVKVDDAYLKQSIEQPNLQVVKGFAPVMPKAELTADEMTYLLAYIHSLGG